MASIKRNMKPTSVQTLTETQSATGAKVKARNETRVIFMAVYPLSAEKVKAMGVGYELTSNVGLTASRGLSQANDELVHEGTRYSIVRINEAGKLTQVYLRAVG